MKAVLLLSLILTGVPLLCADPSIDPSRISSYMTKLGIDNGVFSRRAAAEALGKCGEAAQPAIPALLKALKEDRDAAVRHNAAWALGKSGSSADEVVEALVQALSDAEWTVRHNAVFSLSWIGKPAIAPLKTALADANPTKAVEAIKALVIIDPALLEEIAGKMLELLAHESPAIRQMAAIVAGKFDARGARIVPGLISLLDDENSDTRKNAIEALQAIGQAAGAAVPPLIQVVQQDKDRWTRIAASLALSSVGKGRPEVVDALAMALRDKDARVRSYASSALAEMGEPAIPAIQTLTTSEDSRLRYLAASALGAMGQAGRKGTASLLPLLRDPDEQVRRTAAGSLALIGDASDEVKAALEKARDNEPENSDSRAPYAQALAMLVAPAKPQQ